MTEASAATPTSPAVVVLNAAAVPKQSAWVEQLSAWAGVAVVSSVALTLAAFSILLLLCIEFFKRRKTREAA